MNATSWSFPGRENEAPAEIWVPAEIDGPVPGVVIAGDLMARAGKGLASILGPALAEKGYVAVSATPAANRDASGFKTATLSRREEEVERLVTALFERMAAPGKVNIQKIALVGHGVGGSVAMAEAARDSRVGAVVAIAAPRTPEAYFTKEALEVWAAGKTARLKDLDDGTLQELSGALCDDWRARAELDHSKSATRTGADVVWVHGTADEVVPADESRRAYWKHPEAGRRARLVEIAGAGHDFASAAHVKKLVETVCEQLAQGLS